METQNHSKLRAQELKDKTSCSSDDVLGKGSASYSESSSSEGLEDVFAGLSLPRSLSTSTTTTTTTTAATAVTATTTTTATATATVKKASDEPGQSSEQSTSIPISGIPLGYSGELQSPPKAVSRPRDAEDKDGAEFQSSSSSSSSSSTSEREGSGRGRGTVVDREDEEIHKETKTDASLPPPSLPPSAPVEQEHPFSVFSPSPAQIGSPFPVHRMPLDEELAAQRLSLADISRASKRASHRSYTTRDLDRIEASLERSSIFSSPGAIFSLQRLEDSVRLSGERRSVVASSVSSSASSPLTATASTETTRKTLSPEYRAILDRHKRLVAQSPLLGAMN